MYPSPSQLQNHVELRHCGAWSGLRILFVLLATTHLYNVQFVSADEIPLPQLQREYEASVDKLRTSLKDFCKTRYSFEGGEREQAEYWREKWQDASERCKAAADEVSQKGRELFFRTEQPDDQLTNLALQVADDDLQNHRYEDCLAIIDRALALDEKLNGAENLRRIQAHLRLLTNQFEKASEYYRDHPAAVDDLPDFEKQLLSNLQALSEKFSDELQQRQQDAAADDLPRVEFETNTGKFTIELFENEAPQTVGNFIDLVQKGYYNGVIFHRVKEKFVAQAGGFAFVPSEQGPKLSARGVPYSIYDEFGPENARSHFRGSVSMANQNAPNTGSSQFFICLAPLTFLDGHHTVLGRVIDGMTSVSDIAFTIREGEKGEEEQIKDVTPTMIFSAKVIRKRDHEYEPVRVANDVNTTTASENADTKDREIDSSTNTQPNHSHD